MNKLCIKRKNLFKKNTDGLGDHVGCLCCEPLMRKMLLELTLALTTYFLSLKTRNSLEIFFTLIYCLKSILCTHSNLEECVWH